MSTRTSLQAHCCLALLLTALAALLVSWPAALQASAPQERTLLLTVGDQVSVPADGIKSYSEGSPGIVEVRVPRDGQQLVLVGRAPGTTTLLVFMRDGSEVHYRIQVHAPADAAAPIQVEVRDNVRLDLYFVQVSESYGHQLGVGWPDRVGQASLAAQFDLKGGSLASATVGVVDQALPYLDLAQRDGQARVYRQTAVVAQNGSPATFRSGGEINLSIQGALTAEVRSIEFGSEVRIEPRFDPASRRLELKVGATVSDLTEDGGTGVPGRNVAELDTMVNLDLGKSLVLAGLDAASQAKTRRGLPGLSRIPILGALFGSWGRREEHTKNLLFIVPSVVQAVPLRERSFIEETLEAYRRFDGDVESFSFPQHGDRPGVTR